MRAGETCLICVISWLILEGLNVCISLIVAESAAVTDARLTIYGCLQEGSTARAVNEDSIQGGLRRPAYIPGKTYDCYASSGWGCQDLSSLCPKP